MRILFLTDNFPPEVNAPATRTYEHCYKWVELGYHVTVITCFPNFPDGKVFEGYKNKIYNKEYVSGIEVIRVWSYITENKGFFSRIIDYISYSFTSFIAGFFVKTDIIIATSPQFFTAISGRLMSFFKQKPWIMEVRDLWPDSIVAVGSMKYNSISYRFLKVVENHLYRSAKKIIVVTDSFKKYLIENQKINSDKIGVFKNGIHLKNLSNTNIKKSNLIKQKIGLNNKTVISYIGTHGMAHGLKFILDSIQYIENSKLHFLFIGNGAEKNNLKKHSEKLKIKNFTFLDSVPKENVYDFIQLSSFALINLIKSDEFKNVIPSKIFENIALHKPILLGVEGESKNLIDEYNVGISFIPENRDSFLEAVGKIQNIDLNKFKINADKMIVHFDREKIATDMIEFIID